MGTYVNGGMTAGDASSASTVSLPAIAVSTGNLVVAGFAWLDAGNTITISSVTDTAGNTYHSGTKKNLSSTSSQLWYCYNATANASDVVTATFSTGTTYRSAINAQYSGVKSSVDPLDQTANATGTGTASAVGAVTTTSANETMVAFCTRGGSAVTAGSGFTVRTQGQFAALEDKSVTSIQTGFVADLTQGASTAWNMHFATFADNVATATTLSGPSSGTTGSASTNFTVGADGAISGTVVVTPSDSGGGGTFTPTTVSISSGSPTGAFTYTAATNGVKTISTTNGGGLSNPVSLSYTASSGGSLKYTLVDTTDTITGQQIRVLVPNSNAAIPYNAGTPTPVILYVHGAGETYTALLTDALKAGCVDAMLDAGYILAGTTAHSNNWGNDQSVNDYTALDLYVRTNYNVKAVALWSQSMGGLDGLNILANGNINVVGWLGTYPVCNLANLYNLGTFTSAINTAYGITGSGIYTYANQTYGQDPALKPARAYRDTPMRFYASSGDTVVPKANNTDVLAAIVTGSRSEATVVACSGNHGDTSHFLPSDYVAFFTRCFRTGTRTITETLTSDGTTVLPNLTGLKYAVFEEAAPGTVSRAPVATGTNGTTSIAGVFTISFTSNVAAASTVRLVITDSNGTTTQSPAAKFFDGPVVVT